MSVFVVRVLFPEFIGQHATQVFFVVFTLALNDVRCYADRLFTRNSFDIKHVARVNLWFAILTT